MTCHSDVVDRWVDVTLGRTTKANFRRSGNVFADGDLIFSYGSHFELGRLVRDKRDRPLFFLLNGDRYSVTTSHHQSIVRAATERSGLPTVILPHSALHAAGIDLRSIEIVEVTRDRHEEINHRTHTQPEGSVWRVDPVHRYVDLTPEELQAIVDKRNDDERSYYERALKWAAEGESYFVENPPLEPTLLTVEDLPDWDRREYRQVGTERRLYTTSRGHRQIDVSIADDGTTTYSWTTYRHWLGESLIRARVDTTTVVRCRACKGTGRLNNDPRPGMSATDEVWDAWQAGFCKACHRRGERYRRHRRRAYFLSGFDMNEPRPLYFFCELPKGPKPTTVAEAYEVLKPDAVRLAEQMGRRVSRQGDIFAIELRDTDKRALRKAGATFEKRGNLLGTNHVATEVAYLPDGTTLVRGTLHHAPRWRNPDHRRLTVGKSWHLVVKNTVPVST